MTRIDLDPAAGPAGFAALNVNGETVTLDWMTLVNLGILLQLTGAQQAYEVDVAPGVYRAHVVAAASAAAAAVGPPDKGAS